MVMAPSAINVQEQYPVYLENHHDGVVKAHGLDFTVPEGPDFGKQLVLAALKKRVEQIDAETCEPGEEDSFFVADLGEIYRQHLRWKKNLPNVKPHFAVKCNNDPLVLRLLAKLGAGFDCASKAEIDQVLRLGVEPSRIIYAQPCKTKSYVRYAAEAGVKQMTFDNADELYKIKKFFPGSELFLRISTDDSAAACRLSLKFGAPLETVQGLLELAKELELNLVGVAFHVGSGSTDPNAYLNAVRDARFVFDQAAAHGYNFHTLDVGGGFMGDTFEMAAAALSGALADYFPSSVRVIAEPGRYYVTSAFTVACTVIARRSVDNQDRKDKSYMLYLNDGCYSSFSNIIFDHQHPIPQILKCDGEFVAGKKNDKTVEYSIWGPTCDSIDLIAEHAVLDRTLDVSDWLFFEDMGAYTTASSTTFNGFAAEHEVVYVSSEAGATALLKKY